MAFAALFAAATLLAANDAKATLLAQASTPAPAAAGPSNEDPDFPPGAPTDDYGFVAWCYGALSGQMELYPLVKPELDKLNTSDAEKAENEKLDQEQMKAGRDYLALYSNAMEVKESETPKLNIKGGEDIAEGHSIWDKAKVADPKTRMWSYLNWDLPGRCEVVARKILRESKKD